jgi:hypothetical protein
MNRKQFEKERCKQIQALLKASAPAERWRIRKARREGRRLRKELEEFVQNE